MSNSRYIVVALLWVVSASCWAQAATNPAGAPGIVAAARDQFTATRAAVATALAQRIEGQTLAPADLDAILAVLGAESNKLHTAALDRQLELAARQVETVRTQAIALLRDPANKALAEGMDLQPWLDEIAHLRTVGHILQADLARLRGTLAELRAWAGLLAQVIPPEHLAGKLKSRLTDLLAEWRRDRPASAPQAPAAIAPTAAPAAEHNPETSNRQTSSLAQDPAIARPAGKTPPNGPYVDSGAEPGVGPSNVTPPSAQTVPPQLLPLGRTTNAGVPVVALVQLSPAVTKILKLADAGTDEAQILTLIARSTVPFGLTADHIAALRDRLSQPVLAAMIRRDAELRRAVPPSQKK